MVSIYDEVFSGCTGMHKIYIPASVTNIYSEAFEDCTALTDVYYGGSQSQWNSISIASGNSCLTNATIHYNQTGLPE